MTPLSELKSSQFGIIKMSVRADISYMGSVIHFNPLNAKLSPICHLLALLGAHYILHVSRIRVKLAVKF